MENALATYAVRNCLQFAPCYKWRVRGDAKAPEAQVMFGHMWAPCAASALDGCASSTNVSQKLTITGVANGGTAGGAHILAALAHSYRMRWKTKLLTATMVRHPVDWHVSLWFWHLTSNRLKPSSPVPSWDDVMGNVDMSAQWKQLLGPPSKTRPKAATSVEACKDLNIPVDLFGTTEQFDITMLIWQRELNASAPLS